MTGKTGWLLFGIGLLHLLLGVATAKDLGNLISAGQIFNVVEEQRSARVGLEFWFLIFAIPLMLLGHAYAWAEKVTNRPLPALFGWELLAFGLVGALLDPDSGFWLIVAVAAIMLFRSYRRGAPKVPISAA
jgi:hypothetical protein